MTRVLPAILVALVASAACGRQSVEGDPDGSDDSFFDPVHDLSVDVDAGDPDDVCTEERWHCNSSEDCGGRACIRFPDEPGAWYYCETIPRGPSGCGEYMDECCSDEECVEGVNGTCIGDHWTCGFGYFYHSRCIYDECSSDEDCTALYPSSETICLPALISPWSRSVCMRTHCRVDADCTRLPCGQCRPAFQNCCSDGDCCIRTPPGLYCAYPSQCLDNTDCAGRQICYAFSDGEFSCDEIPCLL